MRTVICFIAGLALSSSLTAEKEALDSLTELRWKNRIILVDKATEQIISELVVHRAAVDERHIRWFCVVNGEVRSNYQGALAEGFLAHLRENYFERTGSPVLLIGKDGGIKSRNSDLLIDNYFMLIDGMPMRQAEMTRSTSD